jgi:hypothetical protein
LKLTNEPSRAESKLAGPKMSFGILVNRGCVRIKLFLRLLHCRKKYRPHAERWLVHNYLKPGEPDFDTVDRDACIRTILGVGADFEYDLLSKEDWYGRRLVADKFRDRCAFIAGDAAHIWVPYAGYGMNAGIADAMNLSWLLAAHLNGWAPASILDAYEAERWPITSQVSRFAMSHAEAEIRRLGAVPDEIEDAGSPGEQARSGVGRLAYEINVQQYGTGVHAAELRSRARYGSAAGCGAQQGGR